MESTAARIVEQVVTEAGYEIILLKNQPSSKVQAWIDRDPEGVGIDDCVQLTRRVWERLEEHELDPGDFEIEIQSPGLDRPLTKPAHFERYAGERVHVRLREKDMLGRRNFKGKLVACVEGHIEVEGDETWRFPLADVDECRLVPGGLFAERIPTGGRTRKPTKSKRKKPRQSKKPKKR